MSTWSHLDTIVMPGVWGLHALSERPRAPGMGLAPRSRA